MPGTTSALRGACWVGYPANFGGGLWFGNDDYGPLNRMPGGSLPAMTWHEIMEYAHQGLELKNLPGLPPNPAPTAPVADSRSNDAHPAMLTYRGAQVLVRLERLLGKAAAKLEGSADPHAPA